MIAKPLLEFVESGADIISYGMGERSIVEIADALNAGMDVKDITYIDGTVFKTEALDDSFPTVMLPAYEKLKANNPPTSILAATSPVYAS